MSDSLRYTTKIFTDLLSAFTIRIERLKRKCWQLEIDHGFVRGEKPAFLMTDLWQQKGTNESRPILITNTFFLFVALYF